MFSAAILDKCMRAVRVLKHTDVVHNVVALPRCDWRKIGCICLVCVDSKAMCDMPWRSPKNGCSSVAIITIFHIVTHSQSPVALFAISSKLSMYQKYALWVMKVRHCYFAVTLANLEQFLSFFHCWIEIWIIEEEEEEEDYARIDLARSVVRELIPCRLLSWRGWNPINLAYKFS